GNPPGTPAPTGRRRFGPTKQDFAQRNGAAAVLILYKGDRVPPQLSAPRGNMSVTEFRRTNSIDNFYITEKVARAIFGDDYGKLESGTPSPKVYTADIKMSLQKMTHELQASDVLGFLPGTD